ncbi:MAG TPA: sigma-70 family RNA polymerase sigma factor [Chloroflexia bacterium]|nr:sigma-70 family RNA polymerase sigma factor [Chloroflexia bacterium]
MSIPLGAAALVGHATKAQALAKQPDGELALLTREARLGSEAAFSALFERFQTPIVNYIYRLVSDWDVANDLAQDTFLKAYTALPRTDESLQISPWLYRIATNTALDALRRRKRITWVPFDLDQEPPSSVPDMAISNAEGDAIQAALALVPSDQRICLVLNMYQGMSYKEIAEMLGISVNLVAVRIYRGREKFIDAYKKANPAE